MNIAIDISPLSSGHKVRGVGFYLLHLKDALQKYFPQHSYTFFTDPKSIPQNVNVVHYPYFDPYFQTLPLLKHHLTVVTVHDLTPLVFQKHFPAGIKGKLIWQLQKHLLKNVDGILTDSVCSKKDIHKLIGISNEKISVVYLAAGETFQKLSEKAINKQALFNKYGLPEYFALYVGDVTWNKNLPRLMRACITQHVPLVMVGKALVEKDYDTANPWNVDRNIVIEIAEKNSNIYRLGFVENDELVQLYNCATVFAMPSLYEGFGLGVIEAMSCGCPVITSKEGSLPEVAGDAAEFVDAYNEASIGEAIVELFTDGRKRKEMVEKGLIQAKTFSWKKAAEQTLSFYQRIYETSH
ncbi:MAG TPA: glycosyltransferase family 1 protein [Patescibacteria group bacterium]|nr:glycosyltransferase family 1 protein [Patescibacteria group bacterium]